MPLASCLDLKMMCSGEKALMSLNLGMVGGNRRKVSSTTSSKLRDIALAVAVVVVIVDCSSRAWHDIALAVTLIVIDSISCVVVIL